MSKKNYCIYHFLFEHKLIEAEIYYTFINTKTANSFTVYYCDCCLNANIWIEPEVLEYYQSIMKGGLNG